ncbi:MAG: AMP-binding protein [bacterium]|nr:AMP-binding protein [bacterium]
MLLPRDYIVCDKIGYQTVMEMVETSCKKFSKKVVMQMKVNDVYQKYTYEDFWNNINHTAKALRRHFFLPGDRAGVYSENRPEWGMSYMGISRSGGIVVPLDAQLGPSELEYLMNDSKTKFIFTSRKCLENVQEVFKSVKSLKKIICFDAQEEDKNVIPFSKFLKMGENYKLPLMHKARPNHILAILYTSGTTGIAKGVMLTQKNIIIDVESACQMIRFDENDTFLSVLPIHHSFEFTAGFIIPLYKGATITYAESLKSKNILDNIKETNVTIMLGVPLLFEKLYNGVLKAIKEKPLPVRLLFSSSMGIVRLTKKLMNKKIGQGVFRGLREKAGMSTIRFFVSGGGPLRADVAEAFDDLGLTILQGYGLTETSPVITVSTLEHLNYYSVGLPLPDTEIRINEPDENGIGEIIARGPMIMKGYYKNTKATREVVKKGWIYTGDEGYIDKDGFVFITGRKKNIIVTQGGKNVFPEEIEFKLDACKFILESMAYGLPASEKDRGEKVYAIIVPDYEAINEHGRVTAVKYDTPDKIENLISHEVKKVNFKLPVYKRISGYKIHSEELMKTSTKKIKRYLYIEKLVKTENNKKQ